MNDLLGNLILLSCIIRVFFCGTVMHKHVYPSMERAVISFDDGLTNPYRKQCCLVVRWALGKNVSDILIKIEIACIM